MIYTKTSMNSVEEITHAVEMDFEDFLKENKISFTEKKAATTLSDYFEIEKLIDGCVLNNDYIFTVRISNHFDKGDYSINVLDFIEPVYYDFALDEETDEQYNYDGEENDIAGYNVDVESLQMEFEKALKEAKEKLAL